MSTLTPEAIAKVAHLARLAIPEKDFPTHVKNLSNILNLVDQMTSANTDDITPMAHPFDIPQPLREDCITENNQRDLLQSIAAPTTVKAGLYIVPKAYDI